MGKFLEVLMGKSILHKKQKRLRELLEKKGEEDFFESLLEVMHLKSFKDEAYRQGMEKFSAVYVFEGQGKYMAVYFKKGKVTVSQRQVKGLPNFKVVFKDEKALYKLVLGDEEDYKTILHSSEISYKGNINYMWRFAFIGKEAIEG